MTHTILSTPPWEQTRAAARATPLVLLVQDTTTIDLTTQERTPALGPIGDGGGRGYLLQSVLAVLPTPRPIPRLAAQEPFLRQAAPKGECCHQRRSRERESQVWERQALALGSPPADTCWVHVGDRYSDIYRFMRICRQQQTHFLLRAAQDRRIVLPDGQTSYLLQWIRTVPAADSQPMTIPPRAGQAARTTRVAVSYGPATIRAPHSGRTAEDVDLATWVVRGWEPDPPAAPAEALEWVLVTSVPTETVNAAWERRDWYSSRWVVEEYHSCLKTGCAVEGRHLHRRERLWRLLGILAPIAVRLLQMRDASRDSPEQRATEAAPAEVVEVVAALAGVPIATLTMGRFWRTVAQQGGYLGRKRDGPPGWKTLWRGWIRIQIMLDGRRLATEAPT